MTLKAGFIGTGGISGKHLNAMAAMEIALFTKEHSPAQV